MYIELKLKKKKKSQRNFHIPPHGTRTVYIKIFKNMKEKFKKYMFLKKCLLLFFGHGSINVFIRKKCQWGCYK